MLINGDECRDGDVVAPKEIEAREQTAEDRAGDVAAVEESQPGNAFRRGLHPPGNRGECCTHEECGREKTDRRDISNARENRHAEENHQAEESDAEFENGIHTKRMQRAQDEARREKAAEAHAAHERAEENAE